MRSGVWTTLPLRGSAGSWQRVARRSVHARDLKRRGKTRRAWCRRACSRRAALQRRTEAAVCTRSCRDQARKTWTAECTCHRQVPAGTAVRPHHNTGERRTPSAHRRCRHRVWECRRPRPASNTAAHTRRSRRRVAGIRRAATRGQRANPRRIPLRSRSCHPPRRTPWTGPMRRGARRHCVPRLCATRLGHCRRPTVSSKMSRLRRRARRVALR